MHICDISRDGMVIHTWVHVQYHYYPTNMCPFVAPALARISGYPSHRLSPRPLKNSFFSTTILCECSLS